MARGQGSFQKMQRERAQREKALAKQARKAERRENPVVHDLASPDDQQAIVAALAELHERHAAGDIEFDEFEVRRTELLEQLVV